MLCGAISQYNAAKPAGLTAYLNLISQRASITGFVVFDFAARYHEAIADIGAGVADGSIKRKFHIVDGLAQAPEALKMLFTGGNTGKLYVLCFSRCPARALLTMRCEQGSKSERWIDCEVVVSCNAILDCACACGVCVLTQLLCCILCRSFAIPNCTCLIFRCTASR